MEKENNEIGFTTSTYFTPQIKKELKTSAILKIISSILSVGGIVGLLVGLFIFFSSKEIVLLIVFGIVLIIGIVFLFFPKKFKKKAIDQAKSDFKTYQDGFGKEKIIPLQEDNRAFSYINANNELIVHQDCNQVYMIPINGIDRAYKDDTKLKNKDRLGKVPLYAVLIIKMKDATEYVLPFTNEYTTNNMYSLESSKKDIKHLDEENSKIIEDVIKAIYAKKQDIESPKGVKSSSVTQASPIKPTESAQTKLPENEKKK